MIPEPPHPEAADPADELTDSVYPAAVPVRLTLRDTRRALRHPVALVAGWVRMRGEVAAAQVAGPQDVDDHPVNWGIEPDGIGISLSGGGIRSASFCLGALQAMEAKGMLIGPAGQVGRAKYLSAVSGGSYIATALTMVAAGPSAAALPDLVPEPPVEEEPERGGRRASRRAARKAARRATRWRAVRQRAADHLVRASRDDRSVSPPSSAQPGQPDMRPFAPGTPEERYVRSHTLYLTTGIGGIPGSIWRALIGLLFNLALVVGLVGLVAIPLGWLYGWVWPQLRHECIHACAKTPWSVPTTVWRVSIGLAVLSVVTGFVWLARRFRRDWALNVVGALSQLSVCACFAVLVFGAAIPKIISLARPVTSVPLAHGATTTQSATVASHVTLAAGSAGLLALTLTWIAVARRLFATPSPLEKEAVGFVRSFAAKHRKTAIDVVAFIGGPILLFAAIVVLAYYGSGFPPGHGWGSGFLEGYSWIGALVVAALLWWRLDVTTWSLYPLYRKRLSSAFVLGRTERTLPIEPSPTAVGTEDATERPYSLAYRLSKCQHPDLPELLICASANISDRGATPSGSRVTSFVFSSKVVGGPLVGGVATDQYDARVGFSGQARFTTLPTAMAISGAAIAPSMGKMTRTSLRLYMALANLRLGVWIPNPRRLELFDERGRVRQRVPRLQYFLREMFGRNHLDAPFLYVTDGGHYENLGLVELLRRKCKTIWCMDASGDKIDTFDTFGQALAMAESELGVSIAINPESDMAPSPKTPQFVTSPYCRGVITYADGTTGTLILVKAGVPADAPWSIRSYQSQYPKFPTDPTVDQLFDADRFDAYRELGKFSVETALRAYNPDGSPVPPTFVPAAKRDPVLRASRSAPLA